MNDELQFSKSAFLVVLAHIKMIIAQRNMTKLLLVISITGHNIAKNEEWDPRTVAKAIFVELVQGSFKSSILAS